MRVRNGVGLLAMLWCFPSWAQAPQEVVRLPDQPPGLVDTFRGHKSTVGALAFSRDGRYLASGGGRELQSSADRPIEDFDVRIWDVITRQRVLTLANSAGGVRRLMYSPDGQRVAALTDRNAEVLVWNANTGARLATFTNQSLTGENFSRIQDLDFLPGNRMLAATNNGAYIVNLAGPRIISEWTGKNGPAGTLAVLPNSMKALSGSNDRVIRMWDVERGAELRRFEAPDVQIEGLRVTPDGRWFVSRSADGTIQVWDFAQGDVVYTLPGFLNGGRQGRVIAITPDGSRLLYERHIGSLIVASAATGREYADYRWHTGVLTDIVVHPGGEFAATASYDGLVRLWRLPEKKPAGDGAPVRPKAPAAGAPAPLRPVFVDVTPTIPTQPVNAQAERNAAEWLVKIGAEFSIRQGEKYEFTATKVPREDGFAIERVNLKGKLDLKEEDLKILAGLQRLSDLCLVDTNLTGTGLAALADCSQFSSLDMSRTPVNDEGLKVIGKLTGLKTLILQRVTKITDQGLAGLSGLTRLQSFRVQCEKVTGSGFGALPGLTNLTLLDAPGLSDEGLRHVGRWTRLQFLYLYNSPITDAGLESLTECKNLSHVIFTKSRITGTGFAALKGCDQLRTLTLDECPVTREGLEAVGNLLSLQELKLSDTRVTNEMLIGLKPMPNLHTLWLMRTPITNQAVECLEVMVGLRNVHIEGTRLSAAEREVWLDRLPGRQILGP